MQGSMIAVAKRAAGSGAELVPVPIPAPGPCEVLVKVRATAICGTDVHIFRWDKWAAGRIKPPLIFGHEFSGEVVETGPGVTKLNVGDYVSAESHIPCGSCYVCKNGQKHICADLKILGVDTQGCFAEYAVIPEACAWRNEPSLPLHIAAIQEPLGNAVYTVMEANVPGKRTLIFGDGPAGLFATGVARAAGAGPIWLAGTFNFALAIGKTMGADRTFNVRSPGVDVVRSVLDDTHGTGADVVIEMSGAPKAIAEGFSALRKGGTFVAFGIPSDRITLDLNNDVIFKGATIIGINGRLMFRTWLQMANLLNSGRLDPSPVVTHQIGLREFQKGFDLMTAPERTCGKVVMIP
ncbi:MAG: L-threonine 3-dehydrogenase [Deltaproteobacteria bacterium]|nr:L-threonine 3-dehydrogenase [Deltaproteobacteria bacterium]